MENNIDLRHFKSKLEEELHTLEAEMDDVGQKNPEKDGDWIAEPSQIDTDTAEDSEVADKIEEYEGNSAVLRDLETRYKDVKDALAKIDLGTYGICEVSGKPIEQDRLEANPAARTCKEHMNE